MFDLQIFLMKARTVFSFVPEVRFIARYNLKYVPASKTVDHA